MNEFGGIITRRLRQGLVEEAFESLSDFFTNCANMYKRRPIYYFGFGFGRYAAMPENP